jgi:2-oxoglutarate dehydrogenase E2 component (dihydrolipoamide succinyltransferase)
MAASQISAIGDDRMTKARTMSIEVKVPVLPESVSDATIATWHKKPGDAVKRDENLVDLETDKVVLEVPAPADGVLKEIKFETGATVTSQQLLASRKAAPRRRPPRPRRLTSLPLRQLPPQSPLPRRQPLRPRAAPTPTSRLRASAWRPSTASMRRRSPAAAATVA